MIVGFHGTTSDRVEEILDVGFRSSENPHSWLGHGRYFFQDAPVHASQWAEFRCKIRKQHLEGPIDPVVFWATIDMTDCLDLIDGSHWHMLAEHRQYVKDTCPDQIPLITMLGLPAIPKDIWPSEDVETLSVYLATLKTLGTNPSTIRATIPEGQPIFRNSWLLNASSIMVNVRHPKAILNYGLL